MAVTKEEMRALKVGDRVHFLFGGSAEVTVVKHLRLYVCISFGPDDKGYWTYGYEDEGTYKPSQQSPMDIERIEPAKVKRSGEFWLVVFSDAYSPEPLVHFYSSLVRAKKFALLHKKDGHLLALVKPSKGSWTEGDGFELLEGE